MSIKQAKQNLHEVIDDFLRERIMLAAQAIAQEAHGKIADGDVILVYSWLVIVFVLYWILMCIMDLFAHFP